MHNLQMHQLRVAACAWQICDSLDIEVDKQSVVTACLLHDMGNIIKFDLNYFPEFNKPEGVDYWKEVQKDFIDRYGNNEHHATIKIASELGFRDNVVKLIDAIDHKHVEENKHLMTLEEKISVYVDNRVNPHKIVSIHDRGEEARLRYKDHKNRIEEESHNTFMKNLENFEKFIFSHSNIKPEDVNDNSVAVIIEKLKEFRI